MTCLTGTSWCGYATEPREVEITVTSELVSTQIVSAQLRVTGLAPVTLTAGEATGGYLLSGEFTLPDVAVASGYAWMATVEDDAGNDPIVVAVGTLRVDPLVPVAAP